MSFEQLAARYGINTELFGHFNKVLQIKPKLEPENIKNLLESNRESEKRIKKFYGKSRKKARNDAGIAPGTPWIPKKPEGCFRDLILAKVDPKRYHALIDCEHKEDLIRLANEKSLPSQIGRFEYDSKSFIIVSWLTTIRIYEYYSHGRGGYVEVKRIPERFIEISPRLVSSLHYNDSKLYIAYLQGCEQEGFDSTKPYLEIRRLNGELLDKPYIYDETISMINSDHDFIYLKTKSDVIYIHQRDIFSAKFKISFKPFITHPLTGFRIDAHPDSNYTKLRLLFTSANELVISNYDIFEHQVIHCFKFEGSHKIISMEKIDNLYIIHRNLPTYTVLEEDSKVISSRVEFGFTGRTSEKGDYYFLHELSFSFKNHIIQIKAFKENLYLFGCIEGTWRRSKSYQVGCIYLPSPKLQWIKYIDDVNDDCHILANENNLVIVKTCQQISCIKIETSQFHECKSCKLKFLNESELELHEVDEHESIFSDFNVFINKYLQDLGASIFKKMQTAEE